MKICTYARRVHKNPKYIHCMRDGTLRKNGCPCVHKTKSFWKLLFKKNKKKVQVKLK